MIIKTNKNIEKLIIFFLLIIVILSQVILAKNYLSDKGYIDSKVKINVQNNVPKFKKIIWVFSK